MKISVDAGGILVVLHLLDELGRPEELAAVLTASLPSITDWDGVLNDERAERDTVSDGVFVFEWWPRINAAREGHRVLQALRVTPNTGDECQVRDETIHLEQVSARPPWEHQGIIVRTTLV